MERKKYKLSSFSDTMLKNSEEFSHKLPELIGEFNKIAGHQMNI